jgi:HSP20 family molecular chaperone IbpA
MLRPRATPTFDCAVLMQMHKSIEVHADIPGLRKKDIKLEVENQILSLNVEWGQECQEWGQGGRRPVVPHRAVELLHEALAEPCKKLLTWTTSRK